MHDQTATHDHDQDHDRFRRWQGAWRSGRAGRALAGSALVVGLGAGLVPLGASGAGAASRPVRHVSVAGFGVAGVHGVPSAASLRGAVTAMAATPGGGGYWLVTTTGEVRAFGTATLEHRAAPIRWQSPVDAIVATPDGHGYWLAASDGQVVAYGDATGHGTRAGHHLAHPIVAMAVTPDGGGYWLVTSAGRVFAFGDAAPHGSLAPTPGGAPVVAMAATPDGGGYWLATATGEVRAFGDAAFHGSLPAKDRTRPVVAMATTPDGRGALLAAADGGVFALGDAAFHGSLGATGLAEPVVALASVAAGRGYLLATTVATPSSCRGDAITTTAGRGQGAVGHYDLPLRFEDTGPTACALHGYPGVAGLGPSGHPITEARRRLRGFTGGLRPGQGAPPTVTIVPGETASARVEGTDVIQGGASSCPKLTGLLVTPPNTAASTRLAYSPLDCSGLEVHPVVPGTSGTEVG